MSGWVAALGAYLQRIFLAEQMDEFLVVPEWLFWEWISRTAVEL